MTKQKAATKATGKGKGKLVASKVFKCPIMPQKVLLAIVEAGIAADVAFNDQYASLTEQLRQGLPSSIRDDAAFKEYQRRINFYAAKLADSRGSKPESVLRAIQRYNAMADWISPKRERSEDEVAEAARKKEANRKALERAEKAIKAQQPKISEELLKEKAKELVAEKREAETEAGKQAAARSKVATGMATLADKIKSGDLGNGNPQPVLERLAAFVASLDLLK